MSLSNLNRKVVYAGNGTTTVFAYTFPILDISHISVVYTNSSGVDTTLAPASYTVTGIGAAGGGNVTYPLSGAPIASNTKLTIVRTVPNTQPTVFSNQGGYYPDVLEKQLDLLTMAIQQLQETQARTPSAPVSDSQTMGALPSQTARPNTLLGFDANGNPYAAQVQGGQFAVNAWVVNNFFPAASAAAARAVLGAVALSDNNVWTGTNAFNNTVDTTGAGGRMLVPTRAAGDNGTDAASTAFVKTKAEAVVGGTALRGYMAGMKLAAAGAANNFQVAAGLACDDTNALMLNFVGLTKTTAAWTAGNNGGSLDTGVIANNTWYHVFGISKADGSAPDYLTSLSVSAPTMPASYTLKRRIGSMKTDGAGNWLGFAQDGDYFRLNASILDLNATNPGIAAVLQTMNVPPGVNAKWLGNAFLRTNTTNTALYLSDPSANDEAPSNTSTAAPAVPGATLSANASNSSQYTQAEIRTNTSAQIRYRLAASGTDVVVGLITLGWTDPRGRNT